MKLVPGVQSVSCVFVALCSVNVTGLFHIAAAQTTEANATTDPSEDVSHPESLLRRHFYPGVSHSESLLRRHFYPNVSHPESLLRRHFYPGVSHPESLLRRHSIRVSHTWNPSYAAILSGCLTSGILPPADLPPSPGVSHPESYPPAFHLLWMSHIRNSIQPTFHLFLHP
uniref:Uncharacterized protein n=1 Tax=Vitis vinifera TaxID=29760 RepID=A5C9Z2_VITVI|nr:hypothetical protein VITISV_024517 [Vitis vinifera]